jgi:hypothetical protein
MKQLVELALNHGGMANSFLDTILKKSKTFDGFGAEHSSNFSNRSGAIRDGEPLNFKLDSELAIRSVT